MDTMVAILKISNRETELLNELVNLIDPSVYDGIISKLQNQSIHHATDDYSNERRIFISIVVNFNREFKKSIKRREYIQSKLV